MDLAAQRKIYKAYLTALKACGATCADEKVTMDSYMVFDTPYGPVESKFMAKLGKRGTPWVYFCLKLWSREIPGGHKATWYGWGHWKQNVLFYNDVDARIQLVNLVSHVGLFFEDRGYGFPPPEVLQKIQTEKRARDKAWSLMLDATLPKSPKHDDATT